MDSNVENMTFFLRCVEKCQYMCRALVTLGGYLPPNGCMLLLAHGKATAVHPEAQRRAPRCILYINALPITYPGSSLVERCSETNSENNRVPLNEVRREAGERVSHLPAPGYCAHPAAARSQIVLGDAIGAGVVRAGDDVAKRRVDLWREARGQLQHLRGVSACEREGERVTIDG